MHIFIEKPKASLQTPSTKSALLDRAPMGRSRKVGSPLHLQRMLGNQALQRLVAADPPEAQEDPTAETVPIGPDLSRMPVQPQLRESAQANLTVSSPGDIYEQEADRIAEQVMRMPEPRLQRACACGGSCSHCQSQQLEQEPEQVQTKPVGSNHREPRPVPSIVHSVLRSPGQPLDPATRAFMEPRFGHDFSRVRVHTGPQAARSAQAVAAQAYTVGSDVVFGAGRYAPGNPAGRRLLAHELTHVVQQNGVSPSAAVVQRLPQGLGSEGVDPDIVAEREYGGSGAPKAKKCGRPSWCPAGFCDPYRSEKLAKYYRSKKAGWLMAGISLAVDSRVVPLWREYLWGGSSPKNLTADFGKDFTNSPTTKKTTTFLYDELKKSLAATPPSVPLYSTISVDVGTQIPKAIAALDDPADRNQMNFNVPKDIPGNLAGGIGKDQRTCPAGAKPSPFDDERKASGTAVMTRLSASGLTVTPLITYSVKDTIDLCPGDCGTALEQVATIPLSQFEATGISGDVPFTVEFGAPFLGSFAVSAPLSTAPPAASSPKKP